MLMSSRVVDQLGNAEADTAADLDRRHQFLGLRLIMMGEGVLPLTHLSGTKGVVRCVELIFGSMLILLLFLAACFFNGPWMQVHGGCITGADVAAWP